jgi:hypothetical protein
MREPHENRAPTRNADSPSTHETANTHVHDHAPTPAVPTAAADDSHSEEAAPCEPYQSTSTVLIQCPRTKYLIGLAYTVATRVHERRAP